MEPSSVLKVRMPLPFRNDRVRGKRIKRVKTPTVLQMEAVECGAASLSIILGYYERTVPLEELRIACGVSRDGSKASNILKAARQYGLETAGYRKEPNELRQTKLPVIIHWNFNHFLVLEGFKKDKVYLNDPAQGPRTVTAEEFDLAFTGVVLTFQPTANFVRGGEKQQILPALWRRLRGLEIPLVYVVLLGLLLAIPGLVIPVFSKIFIDQIMLGHRTDWLMPLVLGIALTALLRTGLNWMQQYYLLRLQTKIALKTSADFFWHIIRLPVEFFNQRLAGEIGSRVMLNDTVAELLSGELASTVLSLIMIIFYFILMLQYSVILTFIGVAVAVLNILFLKFTTRIRQDQNLRLTMEGGKMQGTSMGGLSVIETLKATGAESDFFAKWSGYQAKLMSAQQEIGYSNMLLALVPSLLTSINNVVILAVGGYLILKGQMTVGMLVAFQSLMASFIGPVNQVVQLGGTLQEVKSDMNRLDDVFKYPVAGVFQTERNNNAPVADSGAAAKGDYAGLAKLRGFVELRNISFGYNRLEPPLIENFSLVLKPGSRVALVGGSGSGKSTIAKVLSGLYEPWAGEILFDGRLRDTVPRSVLNFSLAVVDQEITMFEGTVKDNLTLWDSQITEAAMIKGAKDACIHDIIAARPAGYDTPMAEGGRNFSGGQLQRLEIARALINDPAILIMDEATSALDPQTEQLVDRAIRRRGCTCVIVAHRLSTIRDCDEIIVLDRGKVVQRGTHHDLKDQEGLYRELIKAQ